MGKVLEAVLGGVMGFALAVLIIVCLVVYVGG